MSIAISRQDIRSAPLIGARAATPMPRIVWPGYAMKAMNAKKATPGVKALDKYLFRGGYRKAPTKPRRRTPALMVGLPRWRRAGALGARRAKKKPVTRAMFGWWGF